MTPVMSPVRRYRFIAIALAICVAGAVAPRTVQAEVMPNLSVLPMYARSHKKKTAAEKAKETATKTTAAKAETAKKKTSHWKSSKENAANTAAKSGSSMKTTEEHGKTEARTEAVNHSTVMGQKPPAAGMVWVNTNSKVYHKNGSKFYGKTKQGKWMTEAEAQKAGYRSAKN